MSSASKADEQQESLESGHGEAFDRVLVRSGADWRVLSPDEFFRLPLPERVRHVIQRTVTFQRGGRPVDQREALAALRRLRAAK
jgi:hypothetical protein